VPQSLSGPLDFLARDQRTLAPTLVEQGALANAPPAFLTSDDEARALPATLSPEWVREHNRFLIPIESPRTSRPPGSIALLLPLPLQQPGRWPLCVETALLAHKLRKHGMSPVEIRKTIICGVWRSVEAPRR